MNTRDIKDSKVISNNTDIFKFDDAFPDGRIMESEPCPYNMRKAYEEYLRLGRQLTEEEMEAFRT